MGAAGGADQVRGAAKAQSGTRPRTRGRAGPTQGGGSAVGTETQGYREGTMGG